MNNTNIGLFFHLFLFSGSQRLRANYSEEFTSFRTWVCDLWLEGNFFEFVDLYFKEFEVFFISHFVLES